MSELPAEHQTSYLVEAANLVVDAVKKKEVLDREKVGELLEAANVERPDHGDPTLIRTIMGNLSVSADGVSDVPDWMIAQREELDRERAESARQRQAVQEYIDSKQAVYIAQLEAGLATSETDSDTITSKVYHGERIEDKSTILLEQRILSNVKKHFRQAGYAAAITHTSVKPTYDETGETLERAHVLGILTVTKNSLREFAILMP